MIFLVQKIDFKKNIQNKPTLILIHGIKHYNLMYRRINERIFTSEGMYSTLLKSKAL